MHKSKVVVGAGVAGLTLAYKLLQLGKKNVVVVEKEKDLGGLARTFFHDGFVFDLGPHRFFTEYDDVEAFFLEIMDNDYEEVVRSSSIHIFHKYFQWPFSRKDIIKLPPGFALSVFFDLLFKKGREEISFADFVLNRYGKTLLNKFFNPYYTKAMKTSCHEIHRDYASAGVDRATIDKRVKVDNLISLIKSAFQKKVETRFICPDGGIKTFIDRLENGILNMGGQILSNAEVTKVHVSGAKIDSIEVRDESLDVDEVFWSAPIPDLLKLLNIQGMPNLRYLSTIFYFYAIDTPPAIDYQWVYYAGEDVIFSRGSITSLFNQGYSPEGTHGVCIELPTLADDPLLDSPMAKEPEIRDHLHRVGLFSKPEDIKAVYSQSINNTYPIYTLNYREDLDIIFEKIKSVSQNVHNFGRCGYFWYNNMDHSIKMAMDLADSIAKGLEHKPQARDFAEE